MKPYDAFNFAKQEFLMDVIGPQTGKPYVFREYTYGVLVPDLNNPLVNVSVSNSSLSIDLWRGCAFQCKYCHVQDSYMDMGAERRMPTQVSLRSKFSIEEILDALNLHPYFVKDKTILSIGTASTEPFAFQAIDSTFEIMESIVERNWQNPIWIVTKGGFPKGLGKRLQAITAKNQVMLSFCWADNPAIIEPARNNRFGNIDEAHNAGAMCAWYMRPLTKEWGANSHHIENMMKLVSEHYYPYVDMLVPGGLRWAPGIEYGLTEVHQVGMPEIVTINNQKDLSEDIWEVIIAKAAKYFPNVPVYRKSSCALSAMVKNPDIRGVYVINEHDCLNSVCSQEQRNICSAKPYTQWKVGQIRELFDKLSIPSVVHDFNLGKLTCTPSIEMFGPAVSTTLKRMLAQGPSVLLGL